MARCLQTLHCTDLFPRMERPETMQGGNFTPQSLQDVIQSFVSAPQSGHSYFLLLAGSEGACLVNISNARF
jgi:hypothetical protein